MNRVLLKNISIVGLHWGAYTGNEPERIPEVWEGVRRLIDEGKVPDYRHHTSATVCCFLNAVHSALSLSTSTCAALPVDISLQRVQCCHCNACCAVLTATPNACCAILTATATRAVLF